MFHSKPEKCSGVAAVERGAPGTAIDHDQCGRGRVASREPSLPSPRLTLGTRVRRDEK